MNLKLIAILTAAGLVAAWFYGNMRYNEGQSDLLAAQHKEQEVKLAKQTTRQQADETKAAAADESGKTKTEVITRDVIKYVKTPGRNVCVFDDVRVHIKRDAAENAAAVPGYDDAAVQTVAAER